MQTLSEIIDRKWLTNDGPLLQELETRLEDRLKVEHCIAVANGTLALELAIRAMELKGEVILPSFTFVASAHALQWHGIRPIFCDIDPKTLCLDPKRVEPLITKNTTAIMGIHIYGRPCDTEALARISFDHDLHLFYDAAHAIGCSHNGRMIGGFGECEIFSFHATKVFNTIEGGAITTNDKVLADRLRRARNFGFPGDGGESAIELGINAKMNEFCAAIGVNNLNSLDSFVEANKINYQAYSADLNGIPGIKLFGYDHLEANNYQYVIIFVDKAEFGIGRDDLLSVLSSQGILARKYFSPGCHAMEPYVSLYPDSADVLPVTQRVSKEVLALPTGPQLNVRDIQEICKTIKDLGPRV